MAYMKYSRPIFSSCQSETCPVFITTGKSNDPDEFCIKLHISHVTSTIRKVALKAGVTSRSGNTRMLRRSTISSAWKRNPNPDFRQELSHLAGHSYETARRYYAIYETEEQSREVVRKLDEYRE